MIVIRDSSSDQGEVHAATKEKARQWREQCQSPSRTLYANNCADVSSIGIGEWPKMMMLGAGTIEAYSEPY